jgi:glycosyltransferase involved in cell wall biosynthesis
MRILHLLNHAQDVGNGIVNAAVDIACLQAKAGHDVSVASAGGEHEALLAQYGVRHVELDQQRRPIQLLRAAKRYRAIVRQMQPDIVHAHMMTGAVLARGLKGRYRYGLVSTVHNEFQRSAIVMGVADRVIAVSQAVADSMARRGISAQKLRVVCNGTLGSPRQHHDRDRTPVSLHRPAIATVAGMYHRKGIAELIDAFTQIAPIVPAAHLYLIGNGPDRAEFEQQAQQTAVSDRIHFEGFQPDPDRYLKSTDIFVLASRREPFGLVLSEAREAGCAIVASQVDGIPEALDGGQAGWLVPVGDSGAIASALIELLQHPECLQEWQERAQQHIDWLSVARVNQQTIAVYEELI